MEAKQKIDEKILSAAGCLHLSVRLTPKKFPQFETLWDCQKPNFVFHIITRAKGIFSTSSN